MVELRTGCRLGTGGLADEPEDEREGAQVRFEPEYPSPERKRRRRPEERREAQDETDRDEAEIGHHQDV